MASLPTCAILSASYFISKGSVKSITEVIRTPTKIAGWNTHTNYI